MAKRKNLEKVVAKQDEFDKIFAGMGQDLDKMEKDAEKEKPFAVVFGSIKIFVKLLWRTFRWMMHIAMQGLAWLLKRRKKEEPEFYFGR